MQGDASADRDKLDDEKLSLERGKADREKANKTGQGFSLALDVRAFPVDDGLRVFWITERVRGSAPPFLTLSWQFRAVALVQGGFDKILC